MLLYRITSQKYARDLSGTGAGLYGGRWNPIGTNLLYTAGSISLACLEYMAHNFHLLASQKICLAKINIESTDIIELKPKDWPENWNNKSNISRANQEIGLRFVQESKAYALKVPSAIVPDEYNYLLDPLHPDHKNTSLEHLIDPFVLDQRVFGQ
ncbi:RES family NAD+ phosphorylase [Reichenbachiella ulvae]|uniref:RES family NAD+ phosphorylase n=1 Tax=Reichenbachiella ulvae TaxID=2980104 RepID=A0ABT3CSP3_9BACT|nr:RES family NAD+ phosphorylase [Reichenbachiella ulvae]MCV9386490.1 RES family NAD+ phosphorylase [Reichenbachiella ulvae]